MIILTGVAGSGKSVQGRLLTNNYGYPWISTGEILRRSSSVKNQAQMQEGKLLSDNEMIDIIDKVFSKMDLSKEFVLDGFPRSVKQANWLLEQVKKSRFSITVAINLKATQKAVLDRLLQRGRSDDSTEVIAKRFNEYRNVTLPILKHLKDVGVNVSIVNAEQDPKHVHCDIVQAIQNAQEQLLKK